MSVFSTVDLKYEFFVSLTPVFRPGAKNATPLILPSAARRAADGRMRKRVYSLFPGLKSEVNDIF